MNSLGTGYFPHTFHDNEWTQCWDENERIAKITSTVTDHKSLEAMQSIKGIVKSMLYNRKGEYTR